MRLAVIGVGLMGGSIGLVARARADARVVGCDIDADALSRALELGAIDETASGVADAVRDADVVFIASPVGVAPRLAAEALDAAGPECVVSDVGSTKRHIARAISDPRFIGGHPLAGAETSGVRHAREDLFDGAVWYLAPALGTLTALYERLEGVIESLGARPVVIEPDAHDRLMASVSQLPHVLANLLVAQAARAADAVAGAEALRSVGALAANPSFRDATRVAGANTSIWTDIYMSNSDLLAQALDEAIEELSAVRDALDSEEAGQLAAWNERARTARERLAQPGP